MFRAVRVLLPRRQSGGVQALVRNELRNAWELNNFQIFRIVTLKSFNECDAEPRSEVRIFAVGLLSATPARITKNVYVW